MALLGLVGTENAAEAPGAAASAAGDETDVAGGAEADDAP
jgi:hypothetical protein